VKAGRLARLTLLPGDAAHECHRRVVIPSALLAGVSLNKAVVQGETAQGKNRQIELRFKGRTDLLDGRIAEK